MCKARLTHGVPKLREAQLLRAGLCAGSMHGRAHIPRPRGDTREAENRIQDAKRLRDAAQRHVLFSYACLKVAESCKRNGGK